MSKKRRGIKYARSAKPDPQQELLTLPAPESAFEKWIKRPLAQLITGCLALILLAGFIFSTTNGDITVWGDDVFLISHVRISSFNYFDAIRNRGYLNPFYSLVFDLNGQSTRRTHVFFFVLLVLSSLLLYVVLRKMLGAVPAIVGATFYLAYAGRFETVTWMSAGAYLVAANVLFLSVWIALSDRLGPWTKAACITLINWLTVLLCEILIVVAPLYPVVYLLHRWLGRRPVEWRAFAATFLPLGMFLTHTLMIYVATPNGQPLMWQRDLSSFGYLGGLDEQIWRGFQNGFSAGIGSRHVSTVGLELERFWAHVPFGAYAAVTALGAVVAIAILFRVYPVLRFHKRIAVPLLLAGLYLALLSPLVGFSTNPLFMPSRLLTLVGVGLALLVAAAVAWARSTRVPVVRFGIPALLLALSGVEAVAMNTMLYDYQSSWAYDSNIRKQLLASGIHPQPGDAIFISLPPRPLDHTPHIGSSQFHGGNAEVLLSMDYGMVNRLNEKPLTVHASIREAGVVPYKPAPRPGHQLYCFSVSDRDLRLARTDCETVR
jgi:hypothetical protein